MKSRPSSMNRRTFLRRTAGLTAGLSAAALGLSPARAQSSRPAARSSDDSRAELVTTLEELVAELEQRAPYACATVLEDRRLRITVDDHTSDIDAGAVVAGVVLTVYNGRWFQEAATSDLTPDGLRRMAATLAAETRPQTGGVEIDPGAASRRRFATDCIEDPRQLGVEQLFERVRTQHEHARRIFLAEAGAEDRVANCTASYSHSLVREIFVNRRRTWEQDLVRVRGFVSFTSTDGRSTSSNWLSGGAMGGLERLHVDDGAIALAARDSLELLSAVRVPAGDYEVVVDGDITGTLAHESFGHGVELDMFVKDRALAEEFIGKRIGSDLVDIVDDPGLEGAYGGYFFDHEGLEAAPTLVVENGIFLRGLSDLMSAGELQMPRTANGRRQDYARKVYSRMSNTFFRSGDSSVEELIDGVGDGFLVENLTHGMEDPKGWGIFLGAHIARQIKRGKLTGKLFSPVGMTGYVPEVLGSVDGVASDFEARPGTCGKGHKESVPVSTGGPHIRFTARLA